MRTANSCAALTFAIVLLWVGSAQAQQATRYNPFERPISAQSGNYRTNSANTATSSHRVSHPRLRGVLQAEDGSLANLDGHVLAQGESALGYTLLAVQDHSAKFRYRQRTVTLQVTEDSP